MNGTVLGGWEFVAAAYVVTLLTLCAYTVSVLHRYRSERRRASRAPLS
jgi:hypothetical protein